jgi:peptide/nickel transport system substrate-binding protein
VPDNDEAPGPAGVASPLAGIHLETPHPAPLHAQLAAAVRGQIRDGQLPAGTPLPGELEMAAALKEVVAPAGINITIEKYPTDTFWSDAWLHKPAFTSYWNHRHPREILALLYKTGAVWNESKFNSPKVDHIVDEAASTLSPTKQRALFRAAFLEVATKSGVGISFFVNNTHVAKKNVNGVVVDPVYMLVLDKAWLA